eukprot:NODE_1194_length_2566_cov_4.517425.p1 GENE.NODE_1194_length_2566_cov_4.517425~~NODE_1194_length_2566_cov_4.517425.p1  ORF type:complete len:547 (-),score=130.50 NODE_1194_length_2566_cov_4.517425:160-1800(-)
MGRSATLSRSASRRACRSSSSTASENKWRRSTHSSRHSRPRATSSATLPRSAASILQAQAPRARCCCGLSSARLTGDAEDREWLAGFPGGRAQMAVTCRKGEIYEGSAMPNKDNFSVTRDDQGLAMYVICDGHGSNGHLAAYRLVQSLPRFALQIRDEDPSLPAKHALSGAFHAANQDLRDFGISMGIDFGISGASVTAVLQQDDVVDFAWLGDARVLVAGVVGDQTCVDHLSDAHTFNDPEEQQRAIEGGLLLQRDPPEGPGAIRAFIEGHPTGPGLSVSRALGDFDLEPYGLLAVPFFTQTTFAQVPGLVLLASGGLMELLNDGELLLKVLIYDGQIQQRGPMHALACLADVAQARWCEEMGGACDDVSGLVLHWGGEPTEYALTEQAELQQQQQQQVYVGGAAGGAGPCSGGAMDFDTRYDVRGEYTGMHNEAPPPYLSAPTSYAADGSGGTAYYNATTAPLMAGGAAPSRTAPQRQPQVQPQLQAHPQPQPQQSGVHHTASSLPMYTGPPAASAGQGGPQVSSGNGVRAVLHPAFMQPLASV